MTDRGSRAVALRPRQEDPVEEAKVRKQSKIKSAVHVKTSPRRILTIDGWGQYLSSSSLVEKINSPILNIRVGPSARLFQVHKKALMDCAEVFQKMFDGGFLEATSNSATFPEDDEEAWEELIAWAYNPSTVPLPLSPTEKTNANVQQCSGLFKRIKLCALAQKYNILLLHNLAIDTVVNFLWQDGDEEPILSWEVFQDLFRYAMTHSAGTIKRSGLRGLMIHYFRYMQICSVSVCKTVYDHEKMTGLSMEFPDFISDLFRMAGDMRFGLSTKHVAPWKNTPCTFHIHQEDGESVSCPRYWGLESTYKHPSIVAGILYMMQTQYLLTGQTEFAVGGKYWSATPLVSEQLVIEAVSKLVADDVGVEWVKLGYSFGFFVAEKEEVEEGSQEGEEGGGEN